MLLSHPIRSGLACLVIALLGAGAVAGPPGGAPQSYYLPPPTTGFPSFTPPAVGYSSPLYSPYRGLDYSPFAYRHLNPAVTVYGPSHPGYGYRSPYSLSYPGTLGLPATLGLPPATPRAGRAGMLPPLRDMIPPMAPPAPPDANAGKSGTITVLAGAGATVTFDGAEGQGADGRHTYTTKPIPPGATVRLRVKVDAPGGASTISIGLQAGEKATVDLRK
jgi:uncharacterized protein (TIGR03000 family)